MTKKQELIDYVIGNEFITKPSLQEKFTYLLDEALTEQLILSGVSDIVHRAELKVLENVSDYIPCEIYSQAVISSQKKRDNVR
jgi:hypothetical protein